jgi:response regulator of citrate/malate metabolism
MDCRNERGRKDLNTIPSPGRVFDKSLADIIVHKFKQDYHLSAQKLAQSLDIAFIAVCRYLQNVLAMKYLCLQWMTHTLSQSQKYRGGKNLEPQLSRRINK